MAEFTLHHRRHLSDQWRRDPYLIVLAAPDQEGLWKVASDASIAGVPYVMWTEPDMNDQATAVCLAPSRDARSVTGHLPLYKGVVAA